MPSALAKSIYLKLWPSGDFTAYPERRAVPSGFSRNSQQSSSSLGLSHPANSHNASVAIDNESLHSIPRENSSHSFIENNATSGNGNSSQRPPVIRAARGSGGLTQFGKKMTRSACQILEEVAAGRATGFLTLTLPAMDKTQLDEATNMWSEIMRQYMQELGRELCRVGLPVLWVYCTEWQKLRGALHAHIAFVAHPALSNPKGDEYPIQKSWYRDTWQRILANVLGASFDCKAATRIEKVKQSVGSYMSKYISKGDKPESQDRSNSGQTVTDPDTGEITEIIQADSNGRNERFNHPSSWWGACTRLKKAVKERVETWQIKRLCFGVKRQCPVEDQWLELAESILVNLDTYWQRIVYSGGGIPRAIAGRMRLKSGWKQMFVQTVLGQKILRESFKRSVAYWSWRWKKDRCIPDFDNEAELAWIEKQTAESVYYGI